jgi:hypothetical protein
MVYDAFANPLTAEAGQKVIGTVCLGFGFLAVFVLVLGKPVASSRDAIPAPNLRAGNRGQIFFFQNAPVMQFVSRCDVGQRAHRDFVFVGDAAALPGIAVQP